MSETKPGAGTKLGPYEIVDAIGAGGMGEVYRALDPRMGRHVAIKLSIEQFTERFDREVRAVAALNHPNVCTLYDVGPNYLVMELVEGPTLAERIKQGPIPVEEALLIGRQIADALEAAHEKGIVHRDLKPGNVKLRPDGTVKVLDFGLAKVSNNSGVATEDSPTISMAATQAGVILGTAAYMSPEQARGKGVDKRTDIWSFGVVLYEMLTGRRLFKGEDISDTLAAVIREDPSWDEIPAKVRRLLQSCLEKDPKRRLRDIGDAWRLLEDTPQSLPVRRSGLAWIAVMAIAALAVVGAIVLWAPSRTEPVVPSLMRFQIPLPEKTSAGLFAVSPDGRWLVFRGTGPDGIARLWLRALESLETQPLRGTEGLLAPTPFWSPDSRFIAFDSGGKLKKINIAGGPATTVCDLTGVAIGGSWNGDGVILFGSVGGIMRVSASGGTASAITVLDPARKENRHVTPVFLPDGRHFLYLRISANLENSGIYLGSVDAAPTEQNSRQLLATTFSPGYVSPAASQPGSLLYLRDGSLMAQGFDDRKLELIGDPAQVAEKVGAFINGGYFSASRSGEVVIYRTGSAVAGIAGTRVQLWWSDTEGNITGSGLEPGAYTNIVLSPDATRAAMSRLDSQSAIRDIWLVDFMRVTSTRFTFGSARSDNSVWSADGTKIIFMSQRAGPYNDLYQKLANNARTEEVLLKSDENKKPTSWSRDGRFILYTIANPKTKNDIWVLPMEGNRKPEPFAAAEFNEDDGRFSHDGRFVAYVSDESGRSEVYVREFSQTGTGKWLVSQNGGANPRWRGDGSALFYQSPDGSVMIVDITSTRTFPGIAKPLFKFSPSDTFSDVTPDGKHFLFAFPFEEDAQTPFTAVLNWHPRK